MPRRIQNNFSNGMISDVVTDDKSLSVLHDTYVRREGELMSRGPILARYKVPSDTNFTPAPSGTQYGVGYTGASFHPNFGTGAVRAYASASGASCPDDADGFQLVGTPLHSANTWDSQYADFPEFDWWILSENGPGSTRNRVCLDAGATAWLPVEECDQVINTGSEILFAGKLGSIFKWGGSLLGPMASGTVSVAASSGTASTVVTCSSAVWGSGAIEAGQYILIDGVAEKNNGYQRAFRITRVHDSTTLEIETPVSASANTGLTYRVQSVAVVQSQDGSWNATNERPTITGTIAYHQNRLVTIGVSDNRTDYNTVFDFDALRYSMTESEGGTATSFFNGVDGWHSNATFSVFPGIGGAGRGVASMGNDLIVIKAHAMFRVSGVLPGVKSDGTLDTSSLPSVQIITGGENVGAKGFRAWSMTKRGLVVASSDGLYLYDGSQVQSLTDGRISRWWENNFSGVEYKVMAYEDKVIITPEHDLPWDTSQPRTEYTHLVWDMERDLFWTFDSVLPLSCSWTAYTQNDEFVGQFCLNSNKGHTDVTGGLLGDNVVCLTNINHQNGMTTHELDQMRYSNSLTYAMETPNAYVATQSIPLGADVISEGRVNTIFAHARNYNTNSSTIDVGTTRGSMSLSDVSQSIDEVEYGITNATEDRVHRLPIDDFEQSPSAQVHLYVDSPYYSAFSVYAIGIDYEHANDINSAGG